MGAVRRVRSRWHQPSKTRGAQPWDCRRARPAVIGSRYAQASVVVRRRGDAPESNRSVDCTFCRYDNAVSEQSSPFRSIGFGSQVIASAGFRASTYVSRAVALAFVAEVTAATGDPLAPLARPKTCDRARREEWGLGRPAPSQAPFLAVDASREKALLRRGTPDRLQVREGSRLRKLRTSESSRTGRSGERTHRSPAAPARPTRCPVPPVTSW
jgi:hypothetical protein